MRNIKWKLDYLINGQRGQVLILVLIFTAVGILLIPPLLSLAFTINKSANSYQIRTSGVYAADSGVQDGYWQIGQTFTTIDTTKVPLNMAMNASVTPYNLATVNNKQIFISIQMVADNSPDSLTYKIVSTATGDGTSNQVTAYVVDTLGVIGLGQNAISVDGDLNLPKNNSDIKTAVPPADAAAVWANGDVSSNGEIGGNVFAVGTIDNSPVPPSQNYSDMPAHKMVTIDTNQYQTEASAAAGTHPHTLSSSYNNGGTITGPVYLNGDLTLASSKTLTINGDAYVNGSLTVNGDLTINSGVLYVNGGLTITGNLLTSGTVYVDQNLDLSGTWRVSSQGSAILINGNVSTGVNSNFGNPGISPFDTNPGILPLLMVNGTSVVLGVNSNIAAFLYAPYADVSPVNPNAASTWQGAIIAKSLTFGNTDFTYRNDLFGNAYGGFEGQGQGTPDTFKMQIWHLN